MTKAVRLLLLAFLLPHAVSAYDFADFYNSFQGFGSSFNNANTGLTAFPSLLVPSGGLYEGMGTAFTAVASDSSFIEANPAGSAVQKVSELSFLHNNWIADSNVESIIYTTRLKDLGLAAAGKFLYLPFTAYDDWGNRVSKGYYSESIATLNVSYNFLSSYYFYGIAVGANLKAAYRNVPAAIYPGQSALTGMVDVGALTRFNFLKFYPSRERNFSIGAVVRNVGLYAEGEPLPTEAALGLAYAPIRPLTVAVDFNYPFSFTPSVYPAETFNIATGMDLRITDFFALQGGFRYGGADPRITLGSTIALKKITFDVNYTLDMTTQLGTLDHFSIEAKLNLGDDGRAALEREVTAYYVTGLDFYAKGDLEKAISYWEEAMKLDPTFQPAQQYLNTAKRALQLEVEMRNLRRVD